MSLWADILERLESLRLDLKKRFRPENPTSHVDFSIALIALSAKLAKADGHVSRSEVSMFRQIMDIPPEEEARVSREIVLHFSRLLASSAELLCLI